MTTSARMLVAIVGISFGLVALVIDDADRGWTALGAFGVACFAVGIVSALVTLRRARS